MSVGEIWLPSPPENKTLSEYAQDLQTCPQPFKACQTHAKAVTKAQILTKQAQSCLRLMFPAWRITAEVEYGLPRQHFKQSSDRSPLFCKSWARRIEIDPLPSLVIVGIIKIKI